MRDKQKITFQKINKVSITRFFNNIKGKALKVTIVYFILGCLWIILTDVIADIIFIDQASLLMLNISKGIFYVLVTTALFYILTYFSFKKVMLIQEKIKKVNVELEDSNILYKGLYLEFSKKQVLLKSLINSIPDLIFYKDTNSVYLGCNKAFEKFAGKAEEDIIGCSDFDLFDEETADLFRKMDIEMMTTKNPKKNEESVIYPDGTRVFLETLKTPYYDTEGNIIGLIGISRDISERKKKEEEILYLNHHDLLTGLYNRTFLQKEKNRLDTKDFLPLSVIIGDINGLKLINDSLGHAEGDKLIIEISRILKSCCEEDFVLARTGGDEFTILLPNTNAKAVKEVVDKIIKACENHSQNTQTGTHFTNISLGYATKNYLNEDLQKVIQTAEDFMYRQKLFEYKSLHSSILNSIKRTMFEKSNETEEHAERLAKLSKKLGQALELSAEDLVALELLSNLHDIGKISVDKNILTKENQLSEEDWREIRKHPEVGYRIAQSSPELIHISEYILSHHERWDGTGYPQGLTKEEIPLLSRIISIVDAYDAMTQDRSYCKAVTKEQAIVEISKNAGTQFDPKIAQLFIEKILSCTEEDES